MKKMWFCISIILLILTLGIAEEIFIRTTFDALEEKTLEINATLQAADYDVALQQTKQLEMWWTKKRNVLELLCPNTDIKDIAKELGELVGSQNSLMYADAITRSNVIVAMAKNSKNLLSFRLKNIF